ncbi:hypothetical protein [Siphonobacter sp. SORGH_AS_1065]|uniref:hypothetical protein n=1 Tax=Siphonobacter sp. SORGH_AS_1065 TaxID=3041795 RepID=UPI00278B767A|nr:hypothetical protein [Siphonobacter sp. SORGH_AS_1065]MDQ1087481.1 hypothetical protein [Siphonobacter sp. SORGH_AS_1065]
MQKNAREKLNSRKFRWFQPEVPTEENFKQSIKTFRYIFANITKGFNAFRYGWCPHQLLIAGHGGEI